MRFQQSTIIAAKLSEVWPFVADPLLQAEWNPKLVSMDRSGTGPVRCGERFRMIYRMSGRDNVSRVEVTESTFPERVVFRHDISIKSKEQTIRESYDLTPLDDGVRIVQTLEMSLAGIPLPLRICMWLVHHVGRDTEEPYLDRLRARMEQLVP